MDQFCMFGLLGPIHKYDVKFLTESTSDFDYVTSIICRYQSIENASICVVKW